MRKIPKKLKQVCEYISQGLTNEEIAQKMGIVVPTAKLHAVRALRFFKVRNRVELTLAFLKEEGKLLDEYNYEEVDPEEGRSETLVKAIDKIERLENQLLIALQALTNVDSDVATDALRKIKELESENEPVTTTE